MVRKTKKIYPALPKSKSDKVKKRRRAKKDGSKVGYPGMYPYSINNKGAYQQGRKFMLKFLVYNKFYIQKTLYLVTIDNFFSNKLNQF